MTLHYLWPESVYWKYFFTTPQKPQKNIS